VALLSHANRAALRTLPEALDRPRRDPGARAIVYVRSGSAPEVVSWRSLRDNALRCAAALARLGVRQRDVVVIAHSEGLPAVFAFWGALRMGAIPSMFPTLTEKLDPVAYRSSVRLLVRHAGARLVVTSDSFKPVLADAAGCPTAGFGELAPAAAADAPAPNAPADDEVAFLQHSSGTTGLQKGVALSHRAVLNQVASYSDALRLRGQDVVVSWLPLYHDMGLIAGFLLPLLQGLPLVLMSPFDWVKRPALLMRAIHDHGGTLCWLPNFAYNHCARRILDRELAGVSLAGMRAFVNCSEPVLDASHRLFLERFARLGLRSDQLAASYAMAENVFAVTQTPPATPPRLDRVDRAALAQEGRARPAAPDSAAAGVYVSCGPPIPRVEVRIGGGLPERTLGEIQVRSDCMLTGYHGRPELDAELFVDGWYRTGDLGYLADGELYVVGRQKDLIITGGKNLHPHDLEAIVNGVPGVHPGRAVAFGVPDVDEGTELIAVVAEVDAEHEGDARIALGIRRALAAQAGVVASYVHLVGPKWLLKTSSGKLARSANRDKWLAEREGRADP
jgi:acyl-CoA synthetase (AMP-forming)/AMP-acid ligase II